MTLSISVCERVWPSRNRMGFHVVVMDDDRPDLGVGAQEVLNITKTKGVPVGQPPSVDDRDEVMRAIQKDIDQYKEERIRFDLPQYETAATYVENNLNLT